MNKLYGVRNFFHIKKDGTAPTINDYIVELEVKSETPRTITLQYPNGEVLKMKKRAAFSQYDLSLNQAVQRLRGTMTYLRSDNKAKIEKYTKLIAIWETVLQEIEENYDESDII